MKEAADVTTAPAQYPAQTSEGTMPHPTSLATTVIGASLAGLFAAAAAANSPAKLAPTTTMVGRALGRASLRTALLLGDVTVSRPGPAGGAGSVRSRDRRTRPVAARAAG